MSVTYQGKADAVACFWDPYALVPFLFFLGTGVVVADVVYLGNFQHQLVFQHYQAGPVEEELQLDYSSLSRVT